MAVGVGIGVAVGVGVGVGSGVEVDVGAGTGVSVGVGAAVAEGMARTAGSEGSIPRDVAFTSPGGSAGWTGPGVAVGSIVAWVGGVGVGRTAVGTTGTATGLTSVGAASGSGSVHDTSNRINNIGRSRDTVRKVDRPSGIWGPYAGNWLGKGRAARQEPGNIRIPSTVTPPSFWAQRGIPSPASNLILLPRWLFSRTIGLLPRFTPQNDGLVVTVTNALPG